MSSDPRRRPPPPPPPPPLPENTEAAVDDTGAQAASSDSNSAPTLAHDGVASDMAVNAQTRQGGEDHVVNGAAKTGARSLPQPEQAPTRGEEHAKGGGGGGAGEGEDTGGFKLKFCTVCASNNNRSMEAHLRLTTAPDPYPTISFGTGSLVRLPGPSVHQPNVYHFNSTSYKAMYDELLDKDRRLYSANGILNMLDRNKRVKWGPERWQDWKVGVPRVGVRGDPAAGADYSADKGSKGTEAGVVDIVFTCEERCWDAVVDDLLTRGSPLNRPVHVFNVDIKDNHEEALVGGRAILELADALNAAAREERDAYVKSGGQAHVFDQGGARAGFDERVPDILAAWQERWPQLPALWTLGWF